MDLTRRVLLAGMGAALAAPALAKSAPGIKDLVAAANLKGTSSILVADVGSGRVVESLNPGADVPPASVAKAITTLFALEHLGARRFATQVLGTGPLVEGRLKGDLILLGGADPTLDTDSLGDLVAALAKRVKRVEGRFLVHAAALPELARITDDQPDHVGYNAGISALGLNFNRVSFEWGKGGANPQMLARGERYIPEVSGIKVKLADRESPLFTYADKGAETWTVAKPALKKAGSRWLPVRRPADHAAEVFARLCAAQGIDLPPPERIAALPQASVLAERSSDPLPDILRDMLRFSTNVTAETMGLAASGAGDLRGSAGAMSDWAKSALGFRGRFVDHSGLGAASRVTAEGMVQALMAGERRQPGLRGLLKEQGVLGPDGKKVKGGPVRCVAKSGTLNFVSGLAGFIERPQGDLCFAIFSADVARREAVPLAEREGPPGVKSWLGRARELQSQLIARWAEV
ncbi:D-alanyl-D-alanine carboxypeptidase/D-alanyl-D-alanine endopeptidase [Stagnihabitans tardus]|uniref:D-alanyl-D-alanine carboxypeptidase/D-alanyl-D-alanine-endopeptidase n=1 Tax=Stagnihabitans tardus TaxID=2699202 RepID=A0AAE4Y7C0_9RHOB|nr:D-alanyl-D-alanine carboxypeptidase/D-alanyl-D-alanine-endopeptidase [Stagnihabitans tardus]NBZ87211.1 D-alanyl-D-alanine carboxypeptidase/D-alanyl-D-alanine-endopeptidase [Stagnihabitans tardus]